MISSQDEEISLRYLTRHLDFAVESLLRKDRKIIGLNGN